MKTSLKGLLALSVATIPAGAALAPVASAASSSASTSSSQTNVTLKITSGTNVRSGPGTSYGIAGSLKTGTTVTGVVTGSVSNGWAKISSPSNYAGKYVSVAVTKIVSQSPVTSNSSTPAPKPTTPAPTSTSAPVVNSPKDGQRVTRYTSTVQPSHVHPSATSGEIIGSAMVPLTAVTGTWDAASQRLHTSAGWVSHTMPNNPYNAIETHQWQDTDGVQAIAPSNQVVKRYVVANRSNPVLRSSPSYGNSNKVGTLAPNTALAGTYVNSHFFKIVSGAYAGKYISSGVLFTTANQQVINGRLTSKDLCQVPDAMRFSHTVTDQYIGCEALSQLEAFSAKSPYKTKFWEGYRSLATQQQYYKQFGYPRAAIPGTSNHGLGEAIDLRYTANGVLSFSSPQVIDMMNNAGAYGWIKPAYLSKGTSNPEPWHFEFLG